MAVTLNKIQVGIKIVMKMKATYIKLLLSLSMVSVLFSACDKVDTQPVGAPGLENFYYAGFFSIPWNNTGTESVTRTQTTLIKFPVKFHSSYTRDYDAVANYSLVSTGITNPAVVGQDFEVVDKTGAKLNATNGLYALTFPKAVTKIDTIYVKVLNSSITGTRKIEIDLVQNTTEQYTVGTFSQAFKRFVEIK